MLATERGDIGEWIDGAGTGGAGGGNYDEGRGALLAIAMNMLLKSVDIHCASPDYRNRDHVLGRNSRDHGGARNGEMRGFGSVKPQARSRRPAGCTHPREHNGLQRGERAPRQEHAIGLSHAKQGSEGANQFFFAGGHGRRLMEGATVIVERRDEQIGQRRGGERGRVHQAEVERMRRSHGGR